MSRWLELLRGLLSTLLNHDSGMVIVKDVDYLHYGISRSHYIVCAILWRSVKQSAGLSSLHGGPDRQAVLASCRTTMRRWLDGDLCEVSLPNWMMDRTCRMNADACMKQAHFGPRKATVRKWSM
jgi:hypothetical protein